MTQETHEQDRHHASNQYPAPSANSHRIVMPVGGHTHLVIHEPGEFGDPGPLSRLLPSEDYGTGRQCVQTDTLTGARCVTRLCRYNPGPACYAHTRPKGDRECHGSSTATASSYTDTP